MSSPVRFVISLRNYGQYIIEPQNEKLLVLDFNFGPGEFGVDHRVAGLNFHLNPLAVLEDPARSRCHHLTFLWAFLRGVGQVYPALGNAFLFAGADQYPVSHGFQVGCQFGAGGHCGFTYFVQMLQINVAGLGPIKDMTAPANGQVMKVQRPAPGLNGETLMLDCGHGFHRGPSPSLPLRLRLQ